MTADDADAAVLDVYDALQSAVARIIDYGSIPEDEAKSIVLTAVDMVFEDRSIPDSDETPSPTAVAEALQHGSEIGRAAYLAYVDNAGIHCNRFPSWEELSPEARAEWVWKADH